MIPIRRTISFSLLYLAAAWALGAAATLPPPEAARAALGWRLLAERRLALNGDLACLDCHVPALGYTDGKPAATADGLNTPTLYRLAGRTTFGWFTPELRTLEAFVLRPLDNPREMGPLRDTTLDRLRADPLMRQAYAAAFPAAQRLVTWEQTAQALAAAIRSIADPPAAALSPAAARGQALFAELGCAGCHRGPTLSSEAYLDTGVSAERSRNAGRARVPALVGLARTGPYFHDGSAATLADVVRFYQRGGAAPGPGLSRGISPFLITDAEIDDLVAFLASR